MQLAANATRRALEGARAQGRLALVTYFTAGYPDLDRTVALASVALEAGADVVELGVPFSDPLADGPTIQASSHQALLGGGGLLPALEVARRLTGLGLGAPVTLMSYCNPILAAGRDRAWHLCVEAGVSAVVVPDLPPEELDLVRPAGAGPEMEMAFFVAPTSTETRIRAACAASSAFIYVVAVTGVTGVGPQRSTPELGPLLRTVRSHTHLPLLVGFGISSPAQVEALWGLADGVIVGSALVEAIRDSADPTHAVRSLVTELRGACG